MGSIVKLSDLKAAEYNPRSITDRALNGLKFSIEEFGDISGIVYNTRTGKLVAGHQRVRALIEKYGDLEISGDQVVTPAGSFTIRVVDWDEGTERAANIAANAESIQGDWTEGASLIIDEVSLMAPDIYAGLSFSDLNLPRLDNAVPVIEVDQQRSQIPQHMRNLIHFGDVRAYMSDEELEKLTERYKQFIELNRNNYGFVTYLLKEDN